MQVRYLRPQGTPIVEVFELAPLTRRTIRVDDIAGLGDTAVSSVVEADARVIADRTMRWGPGGYGAHAETGVDAPGTSWYFAEGSTVGDFNLFYLTRFGFRPSKIAYLSWHAWSNAASGAWPLNSPQDARRAYDLPEIRRWLEVFVQRFFGFSQFKRSALPNGPKVSAGGSLSPRGDWRAPSDGNATVWLDELRRNVPAD